MHVMQRTIPNKGLYSKSSSARIAGLDALTNQSWHVRGPQFTQ